MALIQVEKNRSGSHLVGSEVECLDCMALPGVGEGHILLPFGWWKLALHRGPWMREENERCTVSELGRERGSSEP